MPNGAEDQTGPTRHDYAKYGGAILGGGLLAGCSGQSGDSSTPTESTTGSTQTKRTNQSADTAATTSTPGCEAIGEKERRQCEEQSFETGRFDESHQDARVTHLTLRDDSQ
jgi:iron complex transport system substrate-binding protein